MTKITLRKVLYDDKNLLFEWRNINELVQLSFLRQKVTLIEHNEWFDQRVNNPLFDLRIIQLNNKDIGLVRMEGAQGSCEVSIYLIPGNQGKGFGFKALSKAINENTSFNTFNANVQIKNNQSQKLFLKLNFLEISRDREFIQYQRVKKL